ncbi:EF-hand domain-containing protein [uncultured Paracoccus sp.]|uniref:EF-hand domain-containing protein n=1 Tax=uncultured Paracoccus sp. TaxID=189685 RepID=UPI002639BFF6|nr:EF-hand domain-containing protein [uncultured Paracoccus sp.]
MTIEHANARWLGLATLALVVCASAASAQDLQKAFARLDENGDDLIEWSEAYPVRVSEFVEMDADRNGAVDPSEFGGRARPFSAFDTDGDEELQLAEYLQGHRSMFMKFDADEDGAINLEEFEQAQAAVGKE